MLTHFFKSINWVDIALAALFIRIIYLGVKTGFVAEVCRFLGTLIAVCVVLHYYTYLAAIISEKTRISPHVLECIVFVLLWVGIMLVMKFVRDGLMLLFKVETTHKGFDQYAAGVLAVGRGLWVCSLTIVLLLLVHNTHVSRMTFQSFSYKIAGKAAVHTYAFVYHNVVDKIFSGQHYNESLDELMHPGQMPAQR